MAEEMTTVGKAGDIPEGDMASFQVGGEDVAVANVGGSYHAFGDVCTHAQCLLSEGDLEDTIVTCPCHGSQFDVTSGAVRNGPATEPVLAYRVSVDADDLRIGM
jgi:3-phenylpropionate/trans-cinnamate dioxygenase ferredoxin subunit